MPRNKHHTKRTNKAHEVVNLETVTDQHKKNVTHHEAVSSSSESTEHWNDQLPDELFSIIIAFCDCFDYTQLVLVSKHMNQLCKKFIPLDIACKKAFMGSLTYEEFITLPLFIQQHRSLHKNLLCQHPKKVSFLLFPNRMTTNTTTTDHHHFEILSNNDDMKNYCLNYALVSAFYQNNKYLSNSWHGFHNLMSLKGVFPHTQKLVSDLAKSIDPRLLFNSSFRKFFVELAEVLANIRSTFQNEKELLSYFSMASSSSVNVEYAKCWFFSMPVLMQTSTSSSLKHNQQYSQYLDEDDKKNEFLCTWMIRHHKMYDIIQMSGQNQSRVVLRRWISHNPTLFSSLPKWIQHDKLVALEAVKENPDLIYPILNTELKQDVSIMSIMLKYTPFSKFLQMARSVDGIRDKVVSNKDLLIEVFSKGHEGNYGLLEFAPPNIKNDKRMIMACLERFYTKYQSLSDMMKTTQHHISEISNECNKLESFYHAKNNHVLFDREVVETWLKITFPKYLKGANFEKFGNDKQLIKRAIALGEYSIMPYLSQNMQQDFEIVKYIVEKNPKLFPVVSPLVRSDIDCVRKAIHTHVDYFELACEKIRSNKEFIWQYVKEKKRADILKFCHETIFKDTQLLKNIFLLVHETDSSASIGSRRSSFLNDFPDHVFTKLEFLSFIIEKDVSFTQKVSPSLNHELLMKLFLEVFANIETSDCLSMVQQFWQYLPSTLRSKSFFMEFIQHHPQLIIGCPFSNDKDICSVAIKADEKFVIFASIELIMNDENWLLACHKNWKSKLAAVYNKSVGEELKLLLNFSSLTTFYRNKPTSTTLSENTDKHEDTLLTSKTPKKSLSKSISGILNFGISSNEK